MASVSKQDADKKHTHIHNFLQGEGQTNHMDYAAPIYNPQIFHFQMRSLFDVSNVLPVIYHRVICTRGFFNILILVCLSFDSFHFCLLIPLLHVRQDI